MTKILPLPVKQNKFGQRVTDISVTDYYAQIFEEVLEAHWASVVADCKKRVENGGRGQLIEYLADNEHEELADIITCCVTRLDIIGGKYVAEEKVAPKDFYSELANQALIAFEYAATFDDVEYFSTVSETQQLSYIISLCVTRLESLGYDEKAREKIYAAVNEKNRRRGYFEV